MEQINLLSEVRTALEKRVGSLRLISEQSGVAYDTVLRIKNREGDPGYSKVEALARHLGLIKAEDTKAGA